MKIKNALALSVVLAVGLVVVVLIGYLGVAGFVWMIVAIAATYGLFRFAKWAWWPRHELPRHRVRHQHIRLFLRLHPGRGHATAWEIWRHWSARASANKDRYARP